MSNKSRARKFADLIGVNRIVDDTATALATTSGVTVEETLAQKMSVANTQALSNARLGATASVALTGDVTGTGSFTSNSISITTDISNSGVTAGTYGSSSQVPSFTVASDGRITSASQVAVAGVSSVSYTSANNNLRVATSDGTTHDVTISTTDKMSVANTIALANARLGSAASVTLTGAVTGTGTFSGNSVSITTTATSDPTITLAGDLTGSVTLTNLGNGTLTASVVDDSHNHIISNVDGLQTALNTKATWAALIATNTAIRSTISSEVASLVDSAPTTLNTLNELAAALGDNPNFATTLTTNLGQKLGGTASITLNGDVSGSGSFSANAVTITTTVADDSHNHIIGNVDGLQSALNMKMSVANTIALANARLGKSASVTLTGAVTGTGSFSGNSVSIATTATADPTLTLAGDVTGSATFTNLGNATLTATVANDSHTHDSRYYTETESNTLLNNKMSVANTQALVNARLGAAASITLTGAVTGSGSFSGNSVSIATTATADPTLTLTGDVTGSATFTNLGNATLTATVADDSHNHIISNVDGLQTALDGKSATSHNHTYDVNNEWLRDNGDNANVKLYGNTRQMAFRTDGTTEYSSGVGAYPFAWLYNGNAAANRLMLLNTSGDMWTSTNGWLSTALAGKQPTGNYLTTSSSFGGDVSGTYNAIVVADDSHNHIISNVDGLQTALDAKLPLAGGTLTGDITVTGNIKCASQIRACGWWNNSDGSGATNMAVEMGVSGPTTNNGYILVYDRDASAYGNLNFNALTAKFGMQSSGAVEISSAGNEKLILSGSTDPYIRWQTNSADCGYIQHIDSTKEFLWHNQDGAIFTLYGGTTVTNPPRLRIEAQSQGTTAPGDMYGQLQFCVQSAGGVSASGLTGTTSETIAMITAEDFRAGVGKTNEDSGLGFYTTASSGSLTYRGGIGNGGAWYVGNLRSTDSTGSLFVENDVRATIFYDRNNTSYYVDPAGNSVLSSIELGDSSGPILSQERNENLKLQGSSGSAVGITGYDSSGNWRFQLYGSSSKYGFLNGNWSSWDLRKELNGVLYLNNQTTYYYDDDVAYLSRVYGITDIRSPLFYDNNDTAYYTDPNNTSVLNDARFLGNISTGNNITRPRASWGANGTSTGAVRIKFPGNTANYGMIHAVIDVYEYNSNDACTIIVGGHNWNGSWYNYGAQVIGNTNKSVRVCTINGQYCILLGNSSSSWSYGSVVLRKIHNGDYYDNQMDMEGTFTVELSTDADSAYTNLTGDMRILETSSNFYAYGSVRSPIFYDNNDTAYYTDPASTSIMASVRATSITAGTTASMTSAGQLAIGGATNPYISFHDASSATRDGYIQKINATDRFYFGEIGYTETEGSFRAPLFYDSDNTAYYVDPASDTSLVINGMILYGSTNAESQGGFVGRHTAGLSTDVYPSPIYCIGTGYRPSGTGLSNMYGIGYAHTNASFYGLSGQSGWGMYVAADGDARVQLNGSNGTVSCTGAVVAYASDNRLKKNVTTITNSLEKLSKIRGVTYDWVDDIATEYDFYPLKMHEVGVIAQEIQEVLPEIVTEAPFNSLYTAKTGWKKIQKQMEEKLGRDVTKAEAKTEFEKLTEEERNNLSEDHKFLTVDYERITPLLIEAIKELNAKVEELEQKLNSQK